MPISARDYFNIHPNLRGKTIAVALSGGPDSVCLLYLLLKIKDEYNIKIEACHLNHGLRGLESDADMVFCKNLCQKLNVPLHIKKTDVKRLMQKGESIELAARRIRYDFFNSLSADFIATAHNKNDSAETIIMNIIRGCGALGASGIPPLRNRIIRPLLNYSKSEILNYLESEKIEYRIDSTNLLNDFSRNKIRNLVFPVFTDINGGYLDNIIRFSQNIKNDDECLFAEAQKVYKAYKEALGLKVKDLKKYPSAVFLRVLILFFNDNNLVYNERLLQDVAEKIANNTIFKINTEKDTYLIFEGGFLSVLKKHKPVSFSVKFLNVNNLLLNNTLDCDKIKGQLNVGTKMPKDTIKLKHGHKKELRKIYSERKIPKHLRDYLPVVRDDLGVVFAYKIGVAERVLPDENSKNLLNVYVEEEENAQ